MSITYMKRIQGIDLPHSEKSILQAVASHLSERNPEKGTWVGNERLAADTGASLRLVEKVMPILRRKRLLKVIGYLKGTQSKKPIYTVHPENGIPLRRETAPGAVSEDEETAPYAVSDGEDAGSETAPGAPETARQAGETAPGAVRNRTSCGLSRYEQEEQQDEQQGQRLAALSEPTPDGQVEKVLQLFNVAYDPKEIAALVLHFGTDLVERALEAGSPWYGKTYADLEQLCEALDNDQAQAAKGGAN